MPVAHVSAIGLMQSPSMQLAMMNAQLASQQMQSGTMLELANFSSLANAAAPPRTGPNPYFVERAKISAEEGEKLIDRLSFWCAMLPVSRPIVARLAEKLERISDRIELSIGAPA